jgi:hypothetical protein
MWGQGHFATWRVWCWTLSRWVRNRGNHQIHQCVAKFPMTFHGKIWKVSTTDFIWFYCILSSSWKCSVRMLSWMQFNAMHLDKCLQCTAWNNLVRYVALISLKHCIKSIQSTAGFNWCDMMWHDATAVGCKVWPNSWQRIARMSSCFKCSLSATHGRNTLMSSWVCRIDPSRANCAIALVQVSNFQSTYFPPLQRAWRTFRT